MGFAKETSEAPPVPTRESAANSEAIEKLKFKHALITTVTDKFILAILVSIAAFLLNRSLETHKINLQSQIEAQKSDYLRELQDIRQENERGLAEAAANLQRELNALRLDHESKLQAIRGTQGESLESIKSVLALRSSLSEKKFNAYVEVYYEGVAVGAILDPLSQSSDEARREAVGKFKSIWRKNRIFLSDHDAGKVDYFVEKMECAGECAQLTMGAVQTISQFRLALENFLRRLRLNLQEQILKEEEVLRKQT